MFSSLESASSVEMIGRKLYLDDEVEDPFSQYSILKSQLRPNEVLVGYYEADIKISSFLYSYNTFLEYEVDGIECFGYYAVDAKFCPPGIVGSKEL